MSKLLVVVDCQKDFVDGALGSEDAIKAMAEVARVIESMSKGDLIYFTMDTHTPDYLNTQEGKLLPVVHCVRETEGWQISDVLINHIGKSNWEKLISRPNVGFIEKPSFGYKDWGKMHCFKPEHQPEEIIIVGLCTDICVISNALIIKSVVPEIPVTVIKGGCAGVTLERHESALCTMASCQININ